MDSQVELLLRAGPFHDTLRAAIRSRGLTLDRVRSRLADRGWPVGLSTLSGWQHGHTRPASTGPVHALEEVLDLPRGALVDLIPRSDLDERSGALGELLDDIPGARDRSVDLLCQHDKVSVDASRRSSRIWSRIVLRARRDGVDRYVMRFFADPGADPLANPADQVEFEAGENCRLGEVRRHSRAPVIVAEFLFGQRLRAGESWVFERRIHNPCGPPSIVHACAVRHRVEQYLLQVRFDPSVRPVDCHAFSQADLYEPPRRIGALPLSTHHSVHLIGTPLITGVHGIAWRWPS
ncbi:hypothetical protein Rhe02_05030 [Rhizocola hellebori]|uniref:Uncharacterized protein n=1 Tax=Rhizocola hellebori TaxID=1392758 RepID=A0A8J3Q300_9ACTN|nr:hypothetical protein [Rhizocola hellebori]GIH02436.1 hypothetical protein Rhe02_05030 [Rhizocola hellebori]